MAIWAVVLAPVESSTGGVTGVSGLYLAAAVYMPLALWFGVWGWLAGYVSCIFMGLYLVIRCHLSWFWGLADFFEGFVPLLIYRSLKIKLALTLNHPKITYTLNAVLAGILVSSAAALILSLTTVFIATFIVAIALLLVQASVEDRKTWITWLIVGVFLASVVSGVFGVGALAAFGIVSMSIFPSVFLGWTFGDIIVLATLGTLLTVVLTPLIVKSKIYVRGFFS